jgi:hypothetical protein
MVLLPQREISKKLLSLSLNPGVPEFDRLLQSLPNYAQRTRKPRLANPNREIIDAYTRNRQRDFKQRKNIRRRLLYITKKRLEHKKQQ